MRARRRGTVPVLLLALTTGGLLLLVGWQFLVALLIAAISAGIAQPVRNRISRGLSERHGLTALIVTIIVLAIVVIPLSALLSAVGVGVANLIQEELPQLGTADSLSGTAIGEWLRDLPIIRDLVSGGLASVRQLMDALGEQSADVLSTLGTAATSVGRLGLLVLIYVFALFYFIKDGDKIRNAILAAVPLPEDDKRLLLTRFTSVSRATLKGTAVVGLLQGTVGGLLFWTLGLPAPLVFGTLFAALAAIPSFGAVLLWLPTVVVLLAEGSYVDAAIVAVVAGGLLPLADYIVRPKIIGDDVSLHPLLLLVAILGGLGVFGLPGLLIGPIIAALFTQSWVTLSQWNAQRAADAGEDV